MIQADRWAGGHVKILLTYFKKHLLASSGVSGVDPVTGKK